MSGEMAVTIFLASPGDLVPERQRARQIVDELNREAAKEAEVFLRLTGWEDTLPGAGRPQALINQDVERCDVFIGTVWKRWGTPSGKHSSGFEEEWTIALGRLPSPEAPQIWLAFKRVDAAQLDDPGEQLQRVLAFRESVTASRVVFYKEYGTTDEWGAMLRSWLITLLMKKMKERHQQHGSAVKSSAPTTPDEKSLASTPFDRPLPPVLLKTVPVLARTSQAQSVDTYGESLATLDMPSLAQLFLSLKSFLVERASTDMLGTHDINQLFRLRFDLTPSEPEHDLLRGPMLADTETVAPGWYWLKGLDTQELRDYVLLRALYDKDIDVRRGAARLLRMLQMPAPDLTNWKELIEGTHTDVQTPVFAWLGDVGDQQTIEWLEHFVQQSPNNPAADLALSTALLRHRPNDALTRLAAKESAPSELASAVSKAVATLSAPDLAPLLDSQLTMVREAAAARLVAIGELSSDQAAKLLGDDSPKVREAALLGSIRQGLSFTAKKIRETLTPPISSLSTLLLNETDVDAALEEAFSRLTESQLTDLIDWFSVDGSIAYHVLVRDHFREWRSQALIDLAQGFTRLRDATLAQWHQRWGELPGQVWDSSDSEVRDYVRQRYTMATVRAFLVHEPGAVLANARDILDRPAAFPPDDVALAASILKEAGDNSDVERLLTALPSAYGDGKEAILATLVVLAPAISQRKRLLASSVPEAVTATLKALSRDELSTLRAECVGLLAHDNSEIRAAACRAIWRAAGEHESARILDEYLSKESYYYNVAVWFDRFLYAPLAFRDRFEVKVPAGAI